MFLNTGIGMVSSVRYIGVLIMIQRPFYEHSWYQTKYDNVNQTGKCTDYMFTIYVNDRFSIVFGMYII